MGGGRAVASRILRAAAEHFLKVTSAESRTTVPLPVPHPNRSQAMRTKPVLLKSLSFIILSFVIHSEVRVEGAESKGGFLAGAAKVDVTPEQLPVRVNGGFLEKTGTRVVDRLNARAVVIGRGGTTIALCVVDTCMMPRELIDAAKARAAERTGIPVERMMVSATHTHSAPAAMGCLGSRADARYAAFLEGKIVEAIGAAASRLQPARIGWGAVDAWELTNCRRWIRRPDRMLTDPFGVTSVRANMHPGYESPDVTGPAGPIDPQLSLLSIQTRAGRPLAVFGNFSMHYFGAAPLSADHCGRFAEGLGREIGAGEDDGFVGILSQGTSGDSHWMDYSKAASKPTLEQYSEALLRRAGEAYRGIRHEEDGTLEMAESRLRLRRRVADADRLEWARGLAAQVGDRPAASQKEVYALEQVLIAAEPERELKLQALRIGEAGITALPNEVYALTGLKLKAQSPLRATFNVELANGAEGYIPPPEQHFLGGYTTWAARTAGLEEQAEPRIVEAVLQLLERVAGAPRRPLAESHGAYARAVLAARPRSYWRLDEMTPPTAADASGNGLAGLYEKGVALHLPGAQAAADGISAVPENPSNFSGAQINRAPHFAGGRVRGRWAGGEKAYSVELWLWNGLPSTARAVTGHVISVGKDGVAGGEDLGIGGSGDAGGGGRLFFAAGAGGAVLRGRQPLGYRTWHHVVLVRESGRVRVYLDGEAELDGAVTGNWPAKGSEIFVGGRTDNEANLEGKADEVAVYDRPLSPEEVRAHYRAAGRAAKAVEHPAPGRQANTGPGSAEPRVEVGPLSPDESRRKMRVPAGFRVDLVAAEPLVMDPVAFDWDEQGRLWVVEMADYPLGMDGKGKGGGRVRCLEDTDGDGRFDRSTLFAEGLNFPNGILTWRDGVIVTAAPEILFLRDTDGDGRADTREVLVSGLFEGNQQLRANGLRWGLDNWVHVASGGHVKTHGAATRLRSHRSATEVATGSRDFRFRPDTGELEAQSGPTQFGRNRDNWGRWFGTQNSNPLWHYVLPDQYLARNPHFGAERTLVQLLTPANPPVFPASPLEKRYHSFNQSGRFTSACSGMIYRDARLFPADELHAFVCEPFHNLVQHVRLRDDGVSFTAAREADGSPFDFLSSEDRWSRPVMVREGPDGAIWVADMYRYVIEHPQFLPAEGKAELLPHYRLGEDRGRIYRISREGMGSFQPTRLERLETGALVAALDTTNGWQRDKVHQMLLWRADPKAEASLREMASGNGNALARLHALCVLDGLGRLTAEDLAGSLRDRHPGVRENALRLSESRLNDTLLGRLAGMTSDPDPKVRLQLAFSLGASGEARAGAALGRLLAGHERDPMMVAAVMSSAARHGGALVTAALELSGDSLPRLRTQLLPLALGTGDRDALGRLLEPLFRRDGPAFTPAQMADFARLLELLRQRSTSLEALRQAGPGDRLAGALAGAGELLDQAKVAAMDNSRPAEERIAAASVLARENSTRALGLSLLAGWVEPQRGADVQASAIRALGATGTEEVPEILAKGWTGLSPAVREAALGIWLSREAWALDLVSRMERGTWPKAALDATQRTRLLKHESRRIQQAAAKLFAGQATDNRAAVVARYRPALALPGDGQRGRMLYQGLCAACHRRGAEGRDIGPDLASVAAHPPEKLLVSILDPSADIQPGYAAYACTLTSGEQLYGLLSAETANSVTLRLLDGSRRTVLRAQIASLGGETRSLMPEGLEAGLTPQGLADLIAFLRGPLEEGR